MQGFFVHRLRRFTQNQNGIFFNHALERSVKIISEGNRRSRFMTPKTRNLGRYFINHALKRSEKIISEGNRRSRFIGRIEQILITDNKGIAERENRRTRELQKCQNSKFKRRAAKNAKDRRVF